jgi:1-acyl-sn-glycerol-3-phosphate acyltransferase
LRPRGPPIALRPEQLWERALFAATGRRLLISSLRQLAEAPEDLDGERRALMQRRLGRALLEHLRVTLDIEGVDNLPHSPHVIVSLHEGMADALCLTQLPLAMRIVARQEIFEWPRIGPAIDRMRHIAIEPEEGAASYRRLLNEARAVLNAGEHVLLFPQGCLLGIEIAFQPGAFRLARCLGAPILPVVITGGHRIWEHPFSPTLRYGERVAIRVLPPIAAAEIQGSDCGALRLDLQRRMKALAFSPDVPPPRRYVQERDGYWDGFAFEIDPDFPAVAAAVNAHRRTPMAAVSSTNTFSYERALSQR